MVLQRPPEPAELIGDQVEASTRCAAFHLQLVWNKSTPNVIETWTARRITGQIKNGGALGWELLRIYYSARFLPFKSSTQSREII